MKTIIAAIILCLCTTSVYAQGGNIGSPTPLTPHMKKTFGDFLSKIDKTYQQLTPEQQARAREMIIRAGERQRERKLGIKPERKKFKKEKEQNTRWWEDKLK